MMSEFKRGLELTDKIIAGKAEWRELFEKQDFFYQYKHYLQVTVSSVDADIQHKLHGLVESTLRHFIMKLENIEQINMVHPHTGSFETSVECIKLEDAQAVRDGNFPAKEPGLLANGTAEDADMEATMVYASQFYIGLVVDLKSTDSNGNRRLDLSWPIHEYTQLIQKNDWWKDSTMSLDIKFKRAHELPEFVLDSKRPRSKKRSKTPYTVSKGLVMVVYLWMHSIF